MTETDRGADAAGMNVLLDLLDLEHLDDDLYRGVSPENSPVRVFGGQVAAQALVASGRTVPADRHVHSLHAYFVRPGDPRVPIIYQVDRTRDGRSFTTRRVVATQHGQQIFTMSSSFQVFEDGIEHADPAPQVPAPEDLPTLQDRLAAAGASSAFWRSVPPTFDIRHVQLAPWMRRARTPVLHSESQVWFRPLTPIPDDPLLHVCVMAYLSDLTLLDSLLTRHGLVLGENLHQLASLDHAMWFHRPIVMNDWVLYDTRSPSASGGRGMATGRFFDSAGGLLATVVQEGLIRVD